MEEGDKKMDPKGYNRPFLMCGAQTRYRNSFRFHQWEMTALTEFRRHSEDTGLKTQLPSRVNLADTNFVMIFLAVLTFFTIRL